MEQFQFSQDAERGARMKRRHKAWLLFVLPLALLVIAGVAFAWTGGIRDSTDNEIGIGGHTDAFDSNDKNQASSEDASRNDSADSSQDSATSGTNWFGWLSGGKKQTNAKTATTNGAKGATQILSVITALKPSAGASFRLDTLELKLVSNPVPGSSLSTDRHTVTAPGEGKYVAQATGTITYTPDPNFTGTARGVGFVIEDTKGASFSSVYTPLVSAPVIDTQPPAPVVCADPSSQGLGLLRVQTYMPYDTSIKSVYLQYGFMHASGIGQPFYGVDLNNHLYRSNDNGQNWRHISPNGSVRVDYPTVSADGTHLYTLVYEDDEDGTTIRQMYSSDSGDTWSDLDMPTDNSSVRSVSSDGQTLTALHYDDSYDTSLYYTEDAGTTWSALNVPTDIDSGIDGSLSDDGRTLFLYGYDDDTYEQHLYRSTDAGMSWTPISFTPSPGYSANGYTLESSADGETLVSWVYSGVNGDYEAYKSTDAGDSWTRITTVPSDVVFDFQISGDGTTLLLKEYDYDTYDYSYYVSRDGGMSWQLIALPSEVSYVDSMNLSGDGTTISFSSQRNYFTRDDGATWSETQNTEQPFDQYRIDLDPATPGQQLVLDRSQSDGWIVGYDAQDDTLYSEVTDPVLFPMPQQLRLPYTLTPLDGCEAPIPGMLILNWESIG